MIVTSTTTCVAFAANGFSEQVPIKAFGIFAAIVILANFVLAITLMPPAMIIYERDIQGCFTNTIERCRNKKPQPKVNIDELVDCPDWLAKEA